MPESTLTLFEVKTCTKCGRTKPVDEFERQRNACRQCRGNFHRQYREGRRDTARAYAAEHYKRNREKRLEQAAEYSKLNPPDPERKRQWDRARDERLKREGEPCSVDGCNRPLRNLKLRLCFSHYRSYRRTGSTDFEVRLRRAVPAGATCSAPGCDEPYEARGLCKQHYRAFCHQQNPEQGTASARRRRARLRQLPAEPYKLADILARDGTSCVLCSEELDLSAKWPQTRSVTVEHLECLDWPESAGDVFANVAAAHLGCNAARRNRAHPAAARKRAELLAVRNLANQEAST